MRCTHACTYMALCIMHHNYYVQDQHRYENFIQYTCMHTLNYIHVCSEIHTHTHIHSIIL